MNKILALLILSLNLFGATFLVDQNESSIKFETSKFFVVGISGSFSQFEGVVTSNNQELTSINGTVNTVTINTNNEKRDAHLKENDYFYISKFPTIEFKSISIKDNEMVAKITIKEISKEVKFSIDNIKEDNQKLEIDLSANVDRQDFALNGSKSQIASNNIKITSKLVAYKKY
ncbi:MAG: YceI family protein [Sulfurospirillum sp.]|nr:YceI family protein [Sulfurospirillum sp.]